MRFYRCNDIGNKDNKNKMKSHIVISWILFAFMFFLIFLGSSLYVVFNDNFYNSECKKLQTDCNQTINVLNYLKSKENLTSNFNEREISHMKDVKSLVNTLKIIFIISITLISILIIFILLYNYKNFTRFMSIYLIYGGVISIILTIVAAILPLISFDLGFTIFHKIFFKGDSWLFNSTDVIINVFPEKFFSEAFIFILTISIIISVILFLAGLLIKKLK